jgi:uncharacterized membrane protein
LEGKNKMKKALKFLTNAAIAAAFTVVIASSAFAQTDDEKITADKSRLYDIFVGNKDACAKGAANPQECSYKVEAPEAKRKAAFEAAREYVKKYDIAGDPIVDFLKKRIAAYDKEIARNELFKRFNTSLQSKNWAETFASGKIILAQEQDQFDIEIILASIAANDPNAKAFSADSINYAKSVIQKLESGKGVTKTFGVGDFQYNTKDNTLAWMNYYIGFLTNAGKTPFGKDSLTYIAKAMQYKGSDIALDSEYDRLFALFYVSEFNRINDERNAEIKKNGDTDTPKSLELEAQQKGYAERAIDAYGRSAQKAKAQAAATTDVKNKDFYTKRASAYFDTITKLYGFRFDKDPSAVSPKATVETYVNGLISQPMPDINSVVAPIVAAPVVPPTPATTTTPPTTKPTTKPGTKPAMTPVTPPATKPTTTPAKVPAKPAPKKPTGKK